MRPQIRRQLDTLGQRTGKEYGKLVQKLLAIAFLETDAKDLVEKSIQGTDLQLTLAGTRHAFEVKTSEGKDISLGKKDLAGLTGHVERGDEVFVAVLFGGLLDDWLFARFHPGELPASKKLSAFQLRPFRDRTLEARIAPAFEDAVERYAELATTERQLGLDRVLAGYTTRHQA